MFNPIQTNTIKIQTDSTEFKSNSIQLNTLRGPHKSHIAIVAIPTFLLSHLSYSPSPGYHEIKMSHWQCEDASHQAPVHLLIVCRKAPPLCVLGSHLMNLHHLWYV
jgi:hypothetical protein